MVIPIVISVLGTVTKGLVQITGGLENKRTSGDHQNFDITKINQYTEKSPGYLRRLAVTQTPARNHQPTLVRKSQIGVE